ncbi:TetR/AcrR family transcriptional regulator [Vallitalea maricola]|uniref:TetR/AcrR family transcriptional regulator n=1 Tax=Vallitalea maricola TaxID=3074433 RepID=A0ACB5UKW7_9FIRM|nr:TetR/AcrR family transcriptional regulator [Vallitalea sp. AN17-2]
MLTRVEREKQIRRESIIDCAERLFNLKGYQQTTMNEIAMESEFTKRTIYKYFTSKQEIYYEIAYRAFKALKDYTDNILYEKNVNGYEKTLIFAKRYVEFLRTNELYCKIMLEMKSAQVQLTKEESQLFQETDAVASEIIIGKIIEEGIKDGSIIKTCTSFELSFMLWGAISGIVAIAHSKRKIIEENTNKTSDDFIYKSVQGIVKTLKA